MNWITYKIQQLKDNLYKLKDYDRLDYDYSCVLCHATCGRMSKTNYDRDVIYAEIDDAQYNFWYKLCKDDIMEILNYEDMSDEDKIKEIKNYFSNID